MNNQRKIGAMMANLEELTEHLRQKERELFLLLPINHAESWHIYEDALRNGLIN